MSNSDIIVQCACGCGQQFKKHDDRGRVRKFVPGHNKPWLGKKRSNKTKEKISQILSNRKLSNRIKKKISESLKSYYAQHPKPTGADNPQWDGGLPKCCECGIQLKTFDAHFCRRCYWNTLKGKKLKPETRKKLSIIGQERAICGKNHPNWKGGISSKNKKIRKSFESRRWREKVFNRDDYTCQKCNERGGVLRAHHIKNFSDNRKLRFKVSNGKTLCEECHLLFHTTHGFTHNNKAQLEEFINEK